MSDFLLGCGIGVLLYIVVMAAFIVTVCIIYFPTV